MTKVGDFNKFDFFNAFSEKQLAEIAKITETKTFKKGSEIYKEGDRANHIFMVSKGWVSLRKIDPERDLGISFENREKGELFGTACFMKPQEYTLNAVCMEDSEVMAIDADKLFDLFQKDYQIGYLFLREIAKVYFERYKSVKRQLYEMVKAPTIITALPG
ncbi:MAG: cyclic nucleotide-binding domain-containing protein [Desulfobacteraceae bacterium]|jgi:CRP/FNR family transcriptional regulator, cyclic AMP receptor protein|nr:cyclic nucleotide-binding domain-containing protein [Desulfobacteraceae bacterium]MDH3721751.1 cyclic nucleotide-binding domain-containing protein [Desulfobacteraceae bacterium]MDH3873077.1 cyclic nucleotide-binding domain-containing protein [Desulfobacteraceae bacterium]MDH3881296.1 cyclic nucleotide-binding domain-containing protein [Desulfobacteraceae bacterium]MDH3956754.1 cyclic nucleotide-binding domain-containing protein [Desulfobacteraceae bacterium]